MCAEQTVSHSNSTDLVRQQPTLSLNSIPNQIPTNSGGNSGTALAGALVYTCGTCETGCCCGTSCCESSVCLTVVSSSSSATPYTGTLCATCQTFCCCNGGQCCASSNCGFNSPTNVQPAGSIAIPQNFGSLLQQQPYPSSNAAALVNNPNDINLLSQLVDYYQSTYRNQLPNNMAVNQLPNSMALTQLPNNMAPNQLPNNLPMNQLPNNMQMNLLPNNMPMNQLPNMQMNQLPNNLYPNMLNQNGGMQQPYSPNFQSNFGYQPYPQQGNWPQFPYNGQQFPYNGQGQFNGQFGMYNNGPYSFNGQQGPFNGPYNGFDNYGPFSPMNNFNGWGMRRHNLPDKLLAKSKN